MDDTMMTLIRSTLEAKASEIELRFDDDATSDVEPDVTTWHERAIEQTPRRRPRVMAAAACLALVAAGVGALVASRDDTDPAAVGTALPTPPTSVEVGSTSTDVQWFLPAQVPDGYELAEIFAFREVAGSRPLMYISYDVAGTGAETPRYGFYIFAVSDGEQLPSDPDANVQVIDGIEYSIVTDIANERVTISWIRDGLHFGAGGFVPDANTLLTAATSMAPVSTADASVAAEAMNLRALALPVLAETTFDDGMQVSVRSMEGIDGGVSLCVDEPDPQCARGDWFPDIRHEGRAEISMVFTVDGQRVILRWRLLPGNETASDGSPVDIVDVGAGYFVRAVVPADGPLPSLVQMDGDVVHGHTVREEIRP